MVGVVIMDIAIAVGGHWFDCRDGQIGHNLPVHMSNLSGFNCPRAVA